MKALITAGGRATRLRPITQTINKHLIPLGNRPMVVYAIEKLVEAGVTDIAINVNPGENDIQRVCGDGSRWGAKLTFIEQLGGPKGLAHIIAPFDAEILLQDISGKRHKILCADALNDSYYKLPQRLKSFFICG